MPLSKSAYDRMMADPARSAAAKRGAVTRRRNEEKRRAAIRSLSAELGRWPSEPEIEARLVEVYGPDWRKPDRHR